jgi:hypothetical protein
MEDRARTVNRPFSELLKAMGPLQPDFGKYRFLRCDTTPTAARLAYARDGEPDAAQERIEFMVILFNLESRDPRLQLPRN